MLHIIRMLLCAVVCPALMLTSCINDNGPFADDNDSPADDGCRLALSVSLLESRNSRNIPACERMHSLRVVVLSKATDKVEFNRHYDLSEDGEAQYGPIVIPVKPDGTKTIYLIANEESAGDLVNPGAQGTLSGFLSNTLLGSNASTFADGIDNAVFNMPGTSYGGSTYIPMSAVYEIETSEADNGKQKDCGTLHIVRTMTKYTISFHNDRVSGLPVYVKSWEIRGLVKEKAYLMPNLSPENDRWGYFYDSTGKEWSEMGSGWTKKGVEWKNWLAKVSDESNIDPDNPEADVNGWMTCYNIPDGAEQQILTHEYADKGLEIPIDGKTHDGEVIKYRPESKNLKTGGDIAFAGEQEYYMNVFVTEGNSDVVHSFSTPVALPNLRSLFRNTHVSVNVKFGQTMKDDVIFAKIIDWTIWGHVNGILEPEE